MLKTYLELTATILILSSLFFGQTPSSNNINKIRLDLPLKLCWTFTDQNAYHNKIASDKSYVFVSLSDGKVVALDSDSRSLVWTTDLGSLAENTPFYLESNLYIVSETNLNTAAEEVAKNNKRTESKYIIRCLDGQTGIVLWQTKPTAILGFSSNTVFHLSLSNDTLYVVTSEGEMYKYNALDGELIGGKNLRAKITAVFFYKNEKVILGVSDKRILALSLADFEVVSELKTSATPSAIYLSENKLIWGDVSGEVVFEKMPFNLRKKAWKRRTGGEILSITPIKENLLISSLDNYIYLVEGKSGKIIWKKRLMSRLSAKPLILGNLIVSGTVGDSTAVVSDAESGRTINKFTFGESISMDGSPQIFSSSIAFPTNAGIHFLTSEGGCL